MGGIGVRLFRLAEAAVDHPDDIVREALYPVEKTLRELAKEAKANDQVFQARVRTVLRSSYSNHYRRMLPALLAALDFRCNNTAYRPVMVAMELLQRYASIDGKVRFYDTHALTPLDGVVPKAWRRRWSMRRAGLSASRTSCVCWSRCGMRSAAARST